MAISCGRTAPNTTHWIAWASRCPVENLGRTNRSNGGETSWQPRRKPPRKRNTKRTDAHSKEFPKASQEKHLLRGFSSHRKGTNFALYRMGEKCDFLIFTDGIRVVLTIQSPWRLPVCTFGCCSVARVVLKTRIQEYGNGLHEPA